MADKQSTFSRFIAQIPILRRLPEVPPDARKEARHEIINTTIFAGMPFWFPLLCYAILIQPPPLLESLRNGELLIYAATLVGPLAYITTKRYGRFVAPNDDPSQPDHPLSYPFPEGRNAVTLAMVICIIAGVVVTLQKLQTLPILGGVKIINPNGLAISSLVVLIVSTLLIYCVSSYKNFMDILSQEKSNDISRSQSEQEDALAAAWRARKEQQ